MHGNEWCYGLQELTNGDVDVIRTDILEKVDNFRTSRPDVELGKTRVVAHAHILSRRCELLLNVVEPRRLCTSATM